MSKAPSNPKTNPRASTQNHLLISEIQDGIVMLRDGSMRAVLLATSVNFDLKSQAEQDSIEFAFQGFLNSLNFSLQIVIRSRKIDLDNYIAGLEQAQLTQDNALLQNLMTDYISSIRQLIESVNIMDKEFYVVIPFFPPVITKTNFVSRLQSILKPQQDVVQQSAGEFEAHKAELLQRTDIVAAGLGQLGIRAISLSTQELIELYYGIYNADVAQNQKLIGTEDLATAAVTQEGNDGLI